MHFCRGEFTGSEHTYKKKIEKSPSLENISLNTTQVSHGSVFADDTSMFKTGRNSQLICSRISEDLSIPVPPTGLLFGECNSMQKTANL